MTTIANLGTLEEARNLQMILDREGISSFVPDAYSAGVAPHLFMSPSGIRLQVAEEDAEAAIRILNEAFAIAN